MLLLPSGSVLRDRGESCTAVSCEICICLEVVREAAQTMSSNGKQRSLEHVCSQVFGGKGGNGLAQAYSLKENHVKGKYPCLLLYAQVLISRGVDSVCICDRPPVIGVCVCVCDARVS